LIAGQEQVPTSTPDVATASEAFATEEDDDLPF